MASDNALDLARLLLRSTVGGVLVAHGLKHGRPLPGTSADRPRRGRRSARHLGPIGRAFVSDSPPTLGT